MSRAFSTSEPASSQPSSSQPSLSQPSSRPPSVPAVAPAVAPAVERTRLRLPRVPLPMRLLISYLALLAIAAVPNFVYVRARLDASLIREAQEQLLEVASRTAAMLAPLQPGIRLERVHDLGRMTGDRITLVAADGRVLYDSRVTDPASLRSHADREEIREAITGGVGAARRTSQSTQTETVYAAARLTDPTTSAIIAVIRVARPLSTVRSSTEDLTRFARNIEAAAISVALLLSLVAAMRFVRPLQRVVAAAKALGSGDLAARSGVSSNDEVGDVGRAIDTLAHELRRRLANAGSGDAVLAQLVDALPVACVVFEVTGEVLALNGAARATFHIEGAHAARRLKELIATARFEQALAAAEGDGEPEPLDVEVATEVRVKSTVHVLKRPGVAPLYVLLGSSAHMAAVTTLPPHDTVHALRLLDLLEQARQASWAALQEAGLALELGEPPDVLVADVAGRVPRALAACLDACARAADGRSLGIESQVEATRVKLVIQAAAPPEAVMRILPLIEPLGGAVEVDGQRTTTVWIPRA